MFGVWENKSEISENGRVENVAQLWGKKTSNQENKAYSLQKVFIFVGHNARSYFDF